MRRNVIETVMGAVVLLVAAIFLGLSWTSTRGSGSGGYEVTADFARVDGLSVGADVRISGIKVGSVIAQTLVPETFLAVVRLSLDRSVKLPADSSAAIVSDGLLGGKYMAIEPGGDEKTIPAGGRITHTQASVSLEQLIGQLIFSGGGKKDEKKDGSAGPQGGPPGQGAPPGTGPAPGARPPSAPAQ